MTRGAEGLPVSVQVRLVRHARNIGMDPNLVLARFAIERFLYRLSRSAYADRFVLKGALLMLVWLGETIRATRDADLLGTGELSAPSIAGILREVCATPVEPDGLEFRPETIRVDMIRQENVYGGTRGTLGARLGNARLRLQLDIGIGDAVVPSPEWLVYPALLDFPRPHLLAYRPETAIAEKLHAMVEFGEANSRMRDFFDVFMLAERREFVRRILSSAIRATFERRRTPVPRGLPLALTPGFARAREKQIQWEGFLRRQGLTSISSDLTVVVEQIAEFLGPAMAGIRGAAATKEKWNPGGPWQRE
jgi:predicted nucleotidyltransferase component of viral defense system